MRMPFVARVLCGVLVFATTFTFELLASASPPQTQRGVVSDDFKDDFRKARPQSTKPVKTSGHAGRTPPPKYTAAIPITQSFGPNAVQVGLTIWRIERVFGTTFTSTDRPGQWEWISKRVAADTKFQDGDLLRLSFESPRAGYLYVINRDRLTDGSYGVTKLIFPVQGEDNSLAAGKLIDIPAEDHPPFRASPSAMQAGELLTILVTSAPLPLSLSDVALPISDSQLIEWEEKWGGFSQRFEMKDGVGQTRTDAEHQAASRKRARDLTREDPAPQTIFVVSPRNNDGLLLNLILSYVR